jgi:sortase A
MALPAAFAAPVTMLLTICGLALWGAVHVLVLGGVQEARAQQQLYNTLREQLASATAPIGGVIPAGAPVAVVEIPGIDAHNLVVVEGTRSAELQKGPGHRRDTALPGQAGTAVLMGRSSTYGGPFARLVELGPEEPITVVTGQGTFHYTVERVRRGGDQVPPAVAAGSGRLTLITSEGTWEGASSVTRQTVYVDAALQGAPQPTPAGRPSAVASAELPMRADDAALLFLVLWLEAVVVVVVALAWGRARWSGAKTLLVGAPALAAVLWGATETALQLLPNLM